MRSSQTIRLVGVLAMSLGLPAAALAGGDATAGKTKATACMACHVSASPTDDTPHLAGQRATEEPRRFTSITLHYTIAGDVPSEKVERAIELSREKYCSVWHSMRQDIDFTVTYTVTPGV